MNTKQQLVSELREVAPSLGIKDINPQVEYPADSSHGDYSTNIALIGGKSTGKNPMDLALEIKEKLEERKIAFLEKIEVVKPGFINCWITKEELLNNLINIVKGDGEIIPQNGEGREVVIEYSSPNIAKPFTIGHLRSTIIGDAVANLLEAIGWKVHRDNHLGDWGTQFGKQIYAIKTWGNEEEIENSEHPMKILVDLYVKFHEEAEKNPKLEDEAREWFKKLENGDEEARRLWQKCVDWSWKEFDRIYNELGVRFTENDGKGYGESFFDDKMAPVVSELEEKGLLKESEGAKLVFFPQDKYPPLMIMKKDGTTLYATRDLATDKFRVDQYGKDITIINEVGSEQSLYFQQLFETEQLLGWVKKEQRIHIKHGLYRFKDERMSTRTGNVVWLDDVLEEAVDRAKKLGEDVSNETAKAVGVGAIKWNDLKREAKQDILFDWDDLLTMQGNSGPYLQYTFARTQSILRKAETVNFKSDSIGFKFQSSEITLQSEERDLLRLLTRFADTVGEAAEKYAPQLVASYLFDLAQAYNLFYQKFPILKKEESVRNFRLSLTAATGQVIKQGLSLLGIESPERM